MAKLGVQFKSSDVTTKNAKRLGVTLTDLSRLVGLGARHRIEQLLRVKPNVRPLDAIGVLKVSDATFYATRKEFLNGSEKELVHDTSLSTAFGNGVEEQVPEHAAVKFVKLLKEHSNSDEEWFLPGEVWLAVCDAFGDETGFDPGELYQPDVEDGRLKAMSNGGNLDNAFAEWLSQHLRAANVPHVLYSGRRVAFTQEAIDRVTTPEGSPSVALGGPRDRVRAERREALQEFIRVLEFADEVRFGGRTSDESSERRGVYVVLGNGLNAETWFLGVDPTDERCEPFAESLQR